MRNTKKTYQTEDKCYCLLIESDKYKLPTKNIPLELRHVSDNEFSTKHKKLFDAVSKSL